MNQAFRKVLTTKTIQTADLVIVTGDITDRGHLSTWHVFWEAVDQAGLFQRILAIPGNHDVCCLGLRMPRRDNDPVRQADLKKAVDGLDIGRQPTRLPWARVVDPRVVVIGLNSNNLGNTTGLSNALGKIGHYQFAQFARLLDKYNCVPVKIVILHHSPNIPRKDTTFRRYASDVHLLNRLVSFIPQEQRRALRQICLEHGVRLLLHGHVHWPEDRRVNGLHIVGAPPTTKPRQNRSGNQSLQFYTHTIQGHGGRVMTKLESFRSMGTS